MEAIPILMVIFGAVLGIVLGPGYLKQRHAERMRRLEHEREDGQRMKALAMEKSSLEGRVEHLESIITSLDFELNAKLNRIATRQLMLPAHAPSADGESPTIGIQNESTRQFYTGELERGAQIGERYVVEEVVGAGGMGVVYRARDNVLDEIVALKIVHGAHLADSQTLDRFRREVATARRIQHPNVVRIHDIGEHEGVTFISMAFVEGRSLRSIMEQSGRLQPAAARGYLAPLLSALQAVHEAGVVHRDIKPDNVLVDRDGVLRIIDFGIARVDRAGQQLTATHAVIGTPEYMAPEQIRGLPVDARTDLYAVGVVAYEMLAGRAPFAGDTPIAVSFKHVTETPERAEAFDDAWWSWVQRSLEKDPSARWPTASAASGALPDA